MSEFNMIIDENGPKVVHENCWDEEEKTFRSKEESTFDIREVTSGVRNRLRKIDTMGRRDPHGPSCLEIEVTCPNCDARGDVEFTLKDVWSWLMQLSQEE